MISPLLVSIKERAKTSKRVWLIIDSPGGSIEPAVALVRLMGRLQQRGVKFNCVVTGDAKSAAFYIFSMCDTRYALKLSRLLYHDGSLSLFGVTLSEADMVAMSLDFRLLNHRINKDIRKTLGFSKRLYDKYKEVTWFPANLLVLSPKFLTIVHDHREAK
jgi:ATP-dependent protease ClpP protease subunit